MRRRWVLRVTDRDGREQHLVVEVPVNDGLVFLSLGGTTARLDAEWMSRLRQIFGEAQARALLDRQRW